MGKRKSNAKVRRRSLLGSVLREDDLVRPTGEVWNAETEKKGRIAEPRKGGTAE